MQLLTFKILRLILKSCQIVFNVPDEFPRADLEIPVSKYGTDACSLGFHAWISADMKEHFSSGNTASTAVFRHFLLFLVTFNTFSFFFSFSPQLKKHFKLLIGLFLFETV